MVLAQADGGKITLTEKADLSERTLVLDKDRNLVGNYDTAGRLTSLTDNDRLLLRQEWYPGGLLRWAANEASAVHPEYDQDGLVTRILLTPPQEQDHPKHWQATKLDPAGRPREITDYRGLRVLMDYDSDGELVGLINQRDGQNYGYQLTRDAEGRVQEVKSSWGTQQYAYDQAGQIERVEIQKGDAKALMKWQSGQLERIGQYDGGELAIDYYQDGDHAGLPARITTPNALVLEYQYDASNRLAGVDLGDQSHLALTYDGKGRLAGWAYTAAK
jgi:YD repeat-containing protein